MGYKTLHPLVSVIDLSKANLEQHTIRCDFYTIILVEGEAGDFTYGRKYYDYSNASMIFRTPGESIKLDISNVLTQKGWLLAFHPDLIASTALEDHIKDYSFFFYNLNESLHLSLREKIKIVNCICNIEEELQHPIDCHSKTLIARYIELLLDYCTRFNERQFITRENKNKLLLARLDRMFDEYLDSGRLSAGGLPVLAQCAAALNLSAAYFSDLLKFETGKSLEEYFEFRRLDTARRLLSEGMHTPAAVARLLGYPNVQCFSLIFKRVVGVPPGEFRYSRN